MGQLSLTGPVDPSRMNLRLRAELKALNHEILDLVGGPFGLSFGNGRLDGEALLDLSDAGQVINARTTLRASQMGVQSPRAAATGLDLSLREDLDRFRVGLVEFVYVDEVSLCVGHFAHQFR